MTRGYRPRDAAWDALQAEGRKRLSDGWAFSGFAVCTIEDIHEAAYDACFIAHPTNTSSTQARYMAYVKSVLEHLEQHLKLYPNTFFNYVDLCENERQFNNQLVKLMTAVMTDRDIM